MSYQTPSIFVVNVVIQNPQQSAVIFALVSLMSVALEITASYLRSQRSPYITGIFHQVSEELVIIGTVGLVFVFVVQSVNSLPLSWVQLFQYVETVIFVMMLFFVAGVISTVWITKALYRTAQRYEAVLLDELNRQQERLAVRATMTEQQRMALGQHMDGLAQQSAEDEPSSRSFHPTSFAAAPVPAKVPLDRSQSQELLLFELDEAAWIRVSPKGILQSLFATLRKIFVYQVSDHAVNPIPMHIVLRSAETIRLTKNVLRDMRRRELKLRKRAGEGTHSRGEGLLIPLVDTMEQMMTVRRQLKAVAPIMEMQQGGSDVTLNLLSHRLQHTSSAIANSSFQSATGSMHGNADTGDPHSTKSFQTRGTALDEGMLAKKIARFCETELYDAKRKSIDVRVLCRYVSFSKYLYDRLRHTTISFIDITWQSWLSLIVSSSLNSLRLYMLPGNLQSKPASELTYQDRVNDHLSFIFLIGYLPMTIFLFFFVLQVRKFYEYVQVVKQQPTTGEHSRGPSIRGRHSSQALLAEMTLLDEEGRVWLPPQQLAGEVTGDRFHDPSRYLLRANRAFTLHALKIPALLIQFYFAMFIVGVWGELSMGFGTLQIVLVPLALLPLIVVIVCLPFCIFVVTVLTSIGLRIDCKVVRATAARNARKLARVSRSGSVGPGNRVVIDLDSIPSQVGDDDEGGLADDDVNYDFLVAPLEECSSSTPDAELAIIASAMERSILGVVRRSSYYDGGASSSEKTATAQQLAASMTQFVPRGLHDGVTDTPSVEVVSLRERILFLERLCQTNGLMMYAQPPCSPESPPNGSPTTTREYFPRSRSRGPTVRDSVMSHERDQLVGQLDADSHLRVAEQLIATMQPQLQLYKDELEKSKSRCGELEKKLHTLATQQPARAYLAAITQAAQPDSSPRSQATTERASTAQPQTQNTSTATDDFAAAVLRAATTFSVASHTGPVRTVRPHAACPNFDHIYRAAGIDPATI